MNGRTNERMDGRTKISKQRIRNKFSKKCEAKEGQQLDRTKIIFK